MAAIRSIKEHIARGCAKTNALTFALPNLLFCLISMSRNHVVRAPPSHPPLPPLSALQRMAGEKKGSAVRSRSRKARRPLRWGGGGGSR